MINFLTELSLIHVILIIAYWFILKNENQYAHMRFYLLGATLFALIIPLLQFPKLFGKANPITEIPLLTFTPIDIVTEGSTVVQSSINYDYLLWIYGIVTFIFVARMLKSVRHIISLKKTSNLEKHNGRLIYSLTDIADSFSFFHWIFVGRLSSKDKENKYAILKHEEAHVKLGHTYDLVFLEIFRACFWWLPTAWYVNHEIRKIHEYEADAHVLKSMDISTYSSTLITNTLKSNGLVLASSFNNHLIFKRLTAMKQRSKNVSPWKFGVLLTLLSTLFITFACSQENSQYDKSQTIEEQSQREIFEVVEEQPTFKGGMDAFYKYVMSEIRYPLSARQNGIEGQVDLQFVIERDGSISNVKTTNGIGAGCDEEAIRVLKSVANFTPGSQRGRTVRVQMAMPIIFKLDPTATNPDNSPKGSIVVGAVSSQKEKLNIDASFKKGLWTGTISGSDGTALPGVNVVLEGTQYGTVTDLDGTFSIEAKKSQRLMISFVGYESAPLFN